MVQDRAEQGWQARVARLLREGGKSDDAIDALQDFDDAMFRFHRRFAKGELMAQALRRLGLDLESAGFQALTAVARISNGFHSESAQPATIGLIGEELSVDPSRASRLVSDLVSAGLVRREAAQDDGRKSVIALTDKGRALLLNMLELKWKRLLGIFAAWSDDDLASLSKGLTRYLDDSECPMRLGDQDE